MAQLNNPSVTVDYPTSPIQRILIAHLTLHEACQGKPLGENASFQEISEEILFYHNSSEDEEWTTIGCCSEQAVSFLGLCKALYALPSSLQINRNDKDDDRTKFIYFGNSMLVFCPLESTLDLVAIVQISRLYKNGVKSDTGSGNPLAISTSIERAHRLFSILHGGGILHRLDETRHDTTDNGAPRYPGMKHLFDLLKEIRVIKDSLSRRGATSNTKETSPRILELEDQVKACRKSLPIQSLRMDLETHYNEYLSYFLEVCIRNGGAGRCLVETMPVPIAQDSGVHIFGVPPSSIQQNHLDSIRESIKWIFASHSRESPNEGDPNSPLLGIAVFESSRLLQSFSNCDTVDLSNGTVSLLMAYMASYRTKMSYVATSPSAESQPGLLKRLLSPVNQTAMPGKWEEATNPVGNSAGGRFLTSPPPFMLGASDRLYSLSYDKNKPDIWAPRVHLPRPRETNWSINDRLTVHMVVFEYLEFSFLIFIHLPTLENPGLSELPETTLLLMDLEEKLSEAIVDAFQNEHRGSTYSMSTDTTSEPGQDIILVERSRERMVLSLDPKLQSPRSARKKRASQNSKDKEGQTRRFMAFSPRKRENLLPSQTTSHRSTRVEWSALGLDCRHLFASRLPLDICLAFDDMINEVQAKRISSPEREGNDGSSSMLELCTCMPHGWIYALATQEKEIYVFFDGSIYVTMADVQSAVQRIKERYLKTTTP